jgi:crotonobetainyl-CoA:carnitine CoA-transferase CaiB-like acyl-CoA transferase
MLPLEGVRVAEFCEVAAGPFCGMLLADMGADVIKIERPEGDGMRQWPPVSGGYSENFASLNRNKRSVTFDLKQEGGRLAARALALSSDVVIENYRPGIMAQYALDYKSLAAEKPNIIVISMSAFVQDGPRVQEGGFDLTLQAIAGVMSVTGEQGGAPVK